MYKRQVQSGGVGGFLGKGLEDVRKELLAHADTGIVDDKPYNRIVFRSFSLGRRKGDLSSRACKFDSVAQNIDEHL